MVFDYALEVQQVVRSKSPTVCRRKRSGVAVQGAAQGSPSVVGLLASAVVLSEKVAERECVWPAAVQARDKATRSRTHHVDARQEVTPNPPVRGQDLAA